jgi:hypothetical protein
MRYIVLLALALALSTTPAFAMPDPQTIHITVSKYNDLSVDGDVFYLVEYTLLYDVTPEYAISQAWLGRLIDYNGLGQLGSTQPYSGGGIPDLGYSDGVYGFYFPSDPGSTGTIRITLGGNPSFTPTPAGVFTTDIASKPASDLASDIRAIAMRLQDVWDVSLLTTAAPSQFTVDGESYFSVALPAITKLVPGLFVLSSIDFDNPEFEFDPEYGESKQGTWDDTPLGNTFVALADSTKLSVTVVKFCVAFVLAVLAAVAVGRVQTPFTGTMQIWAAYLVLVGGFLTGLVIAPVIGLLTILVIVTTGYIFFLQRSSA